MAAHSIKPLVTAVAVSTGGRAGLAEHHDAGAAAPSPTTPAPRGL